MNTLKVGDKLPNFECIDENENLISNEDYSGKKLIVFFYPKANTPGCTAEACNLSENYETLTNLGYSILGVSCDKPKSQKNFSTTQATAAYGHFGRELAAFTWERTDKADALRQAAN